MTNHRLSGIKVMTTCSALCSVLQFYMSFQAGAFCQECPAAPGPSAQPSLHRHHLHKILQWLLCPTQPYRRQHGRRQHSSQLKKGPLNNLSTVCIMVIEYRRMYVTWDIGLCWLVVCKCQVRHLPWAVYVLAENGWNRLQSEHYFAASFSPFQPFSAQTKTALGQVSQLKEQKHPGSPQAMFLVTCNRLYMLKLN